jgi:cell division protein FtsN
MSHDFAKQRPHPGQGLQQRPLRAAATRAGEQPPSQSHWGWFLSGIFCGFLIVGIAYLGIVRLDGSVNETPQSAEAAEETTPRRPVIDYGFYQELANAEVAVPQPPAAAAPDTAATQTSNSESSKPGSEAAAVARVEDSVRYLLQAGSFQDRQDAENRRVKVLLLNMEANVVPGVVSGRTWYRVQVGPFQGRTLAEAARVTLSENNIDSIPLLLR